MCCNSCFDSWKGCSNDSSEWSSEGTGAMLSAVVVVVGTVVVSAKIDAMKVIVAVLVAMEMGIVEMVAVMHGRTLLAST